MTPHVISITAADTVVSARNQLRSHGIHHLVVMCETRLDGILSYRDLIGKPDALTVDEVMSRDTVTVHPTDSVRNAATKLLGKTHGCAVVVEAGKAVGVLTTTDLVRAISHRDERSGVSVNRISTV